MASLRAVDRTTEDSLIQAVVDGVPVILWATDARGDLLFLNQAGLAFCGRSLDAERGNGWLDGVHEDDRAGVVRAHVNAAAAGDTVAYNCRMRHASGGYRPMHVEGAASHDREGRCTGHVGWWHDVTRRDPAAGDSAVLEALIDSAQDMVYRIILLPQPRVEYVGGAVRAITGHTAEDLHADIRLGLAAIHADDLEPFLTTVRSTRSPSANTIRWVHPNGTVVWAEHRRVPVYDDAGNLVAVEGIARDVTGMMEGQRRRRESEDQMRQLAAHVQKAREEERTQLARELHDELGQTLTTLKLEIGRAIAALRAERLTPTVVDRLQSLTGLSDVGLAMVKRIATSLRPPTLDHLGIAEAIRWEALTFKARTGIRCHLRANKTRTALSSEQQTALFRIFQEALTNIARHAKASAVHVTLSEKDGHAELRIRDNGKGITDAERENPRALGLVGMRERAALIGGAFRISGRRGKGTSVAVHVPLRASTRSKPRTRTRKRSTEGPTK
jgi:two-component system, NarL family, sensor histidine kinase UhpB